MPQIARDQFDIISQRMVLHRPTGWEFFTYAAERPGDVRIEAERMGTSGDHDRIARVALQILQDLARVWTPNDGQSIVQFHEQPQQ